VVVWLARARFRDPDGVTRIVERRGPADEQDAHGKLAEDALIDALNRRRAAGDSEITLESRIIALVDQHIDRLEEDGRAVRTIDTYRYAQSCSGRSSLAFVLGKRHQLASTQPFGRCVGLMGTCWLCRPRRS
jgi:hypothetical protein